MRFERQHEADISLTAGAGWKIMPKLQASLKSTFTSKIVLAGTLKHSTFRESKREVALPDEPDNPNELHVKSRNFYWSPVYRRIVCHISKEIKPMNEKNYILLTACQPTRSIATKQKDILSDGTTREIMTGIHSIET
jgi:hypothetical protein